MWCPKCYSADLCLQTFEQLSQAIDRLATRIWIVNVGDLKPYEMNIEFFINYGWDASVWNKDNLDTFVSLWAQREFDVSPSVGDEIATIMSNLTRWNNRRKPELLNSTTFTLTDYRECVSRFPLKSWFLSPVSQSWQRLDGLGRPYKCYDGNLQ